MIETSYVSCTLHIKYSFLHIIRKSVKNTKFRPRDIIFVQIKKENNAKKKIFKMDAFNAEKSFFTILLEKKDRLFYQYWKNNLVSLLQCRRFKYLQKKCMSKDGMKKSITKFGETGVWGSAIVMEQI